MQVSTRRQSEIKIKVDQQASAHTWCAEMEAGAPNPTAASKIATNRTAKKEIRMPQVDSDIRTRPGTPSQPPGTKNSLLRLTESKLRRTQRSGIMTLATASRPGICVEPATMMIQIDAAAVTVTVTTPGRGGDRRAAGLAVTATPSRRPELGFAKFPGRGAPGRGRLVRDSRV